MCEIDVDKLRKFEFSSDGIVILAFEGGEDILICNKCNGEIWDLSVHWEDYISYHLTCMECGNVLVFLPLKKKFLDEYGMWITLNDLLKNENA